jgi:hypothetical protein
MNKLNALNQKEKLMAFLNRIKIPSRIVFIIAGVLSTLWLLIRVIPKPSRLHYPCMRAAAPVAYSFIAWLVGITSIAFFFSKARERLYQSRYLLAAGFMLLGLAAGILTLVNKNLTLSAATVLQGPQPVNAPVGVAKGTLPGRVVWVHDADATDEGCTNKTNDYWWMDINTNQQVVNTMLSAGLQNMTGAASDAAAWDSIFRYHNRNHGKGNTGYQAGEKLAIKINLNGIWNASPDKNINTSPQLCHALLNQLVNTVGVAQKDISIGDPNCPMNSATHNKLKTDFPNVIYWGTGTGRTPAIQTASKEIYSSATDDQYFEDVLPQAYVDAAYLINVPVFKKHHRAGISIACKNHFGSLGAYTGGAWHLHPSLPAPETSDVTNGDYGVYRCFVDIMGHKDLGGKTIFYLVDGLWGSTNWGHPPVKWHMTPFNDDWPSSLFVSMDPVAIESVCYDFLYEEFDIDQSETLHPQEGGDWSDNAGPFPHFGGVDDYLHQAADPANWPAGITYDPEGDGSALSSLGTHEHWNNATDKKYTRNLGTGNGIELFYTTAAVSGLNHVEMATDFGIYPNPVASSATFRFNLLQPASVKLEIWSLEGKLLESIDHGHFTAGYNEILWEPELQQGNYIGRLSLRDGIQHRSLTAKIRIQ